MCIHPLTVGQVTNKIVQGFSTANKSASVLSHSTKHLQESVCVGPFEMWTYIYFNRCKIISFVREKFIQTIQTWERCH